MKTFYCTFSSLRKATRTKSPPKPQNKSTPLRTRTQVNRELSDSDSDLSLTDDGLYSTPIEAKIEVRRYVGKHFQDSTTDTSFWVWQSYVLIQWSPDNSHKNMRKFWENSAESIHRSLRGRIQLCKLYGICILTRVKLSGLEQHKAA